MKILRFIADDPGEALSQIHARLGPAAVVLSVRRLPAQGLSRIWQKTGRVELLAGVPDPSAGEAASSSFSEENPFANHALAAGHWQTVAWLESMGLLPEHAARLQSQLEAVSGEARPKSLEEEWTAVSAMLASFWTEAPRLESTGAPRPHVFIGPPGSGKTTVLCKWLTLAVLTEEKRARVWRLDGNTANTAEFMGIHCEMLGTQIERFWSQPTPVDADLLFIDLPGVEHRDEQGMQALREQLEVLPSPRIHLVLNAAYETSALLAQWRAFAALKPEDLIFTHLDEEQRRVKLWNFVFGTNCSTRFLSAGQKIPGEFLHAAPGLLFPTEIPR